MSSLNSSSSSSWESINATLGSNQCWLCEKTFIKGKVKKMFMISQVLEYFKTIKGQNLDVLPFTTASITKCYNEYLEYECDMNPIVERMKMSKIEPWMSGLACSMNDECLRVIECILSTAPSASLQGMSIPRDSKDCPPNCDCFQAFIR